MIMGHSSGNREVGSLHLLKMFDEFMSFWQQIRDEVTHSLESDTDLILDDGNPTENITLYASGKLNTFALHQQQQVRMTASSAQLQLYDRFLYAIAATIDEKIIHHPNWNIPVEWLKSLMEKKLFNSSNAGVTLIKNMEEWTEKTEFSQDEKELSVVYTRVIWLGFCGSYRLFKDKSEKLEALQQDLLDAAGILPARLENRHLFEASYKANINPQKQSRLAPFSLWKRYLWIAIATYLLVTIMVWFFHTDQLNTELMKYLGDVVEHQGGAHEQ